MNGILEILTKALIIYILKYPSNYNQDYCQNIIFMKIVTTKFHEKSRKFSLIFFDKIRVRKKVWPRKQPISDY